MVRGEEMVREKYSIRKIEEICNIFSDSNTYSCWDLCEITVKAVALFTSHLLPLFDCITAFHSNPRNFVAKEVWVFMTSHSFLSTQQGLTIFFCGLSKDRPSI